MIVVDKVGIQPLTTEQAVEQGLIPEAEENTDPLAQFLDEDEGFIPLYPDDLESETDQEPGEESPVVYVLAAILEENLAQAIGTHEQPYIEVQQPAEQEGEPTSTLASNDRDSQKALPGFGHDKLIKLNQGNMF